MPVPDYETLMLPVLRLFADGARNVADCIPSIQRDFAITEAEAAELIPSGRITTLQSRVHWARTYLSKAGLLESPRRNQHVITERGRELLCRSPARIDNATLDQFEEFRDWRKRGNSPEEPSEQPDSTPSFQPKARSETPDEAMQHAAATLNAALRDDLLVLLQRMSPVQFERLGSGPINWLEAAGPA